MNKNENTHPLSNGDKVNVETKTLVDVDTLGLGESAGMDLVGDHPRHYRHKTLEIYFVPKHEDTLDGEYMILFPFSSASLGYKKDVDWYYVKERIDLGYIEPCDPEESELALTIVNAIEKLNTYRK